MNRATRDKFVSRTQDDVTSGNACWQTPPAVFAKLAADFGPFDVDLTADLTRALCPVWFGPGSPWAADALTANWRRFGKNGFSNPPYGPFVPQMLAKARSEWTFHSTLLLPLRVTEAFLDYVIESGASELWFCDKRITFWENGAPRLNQKTDKADPAIFDSIIVRYTADRWYHPRVRVWRVPPHVSALDLQSARMRAKAAAKPEGVLV
jgi:DNA N-6-adenine-methyltransferase (Dam)